MSRLATVLVSLVILAGAVVVTALIFSTEPTATQSGAVRKTAMLVEVVEVRRGVHRPVLVATGTVEASREVTLSSRVEGEVVQRSGAFTPGGHVRQGAFLLRIDPADYEIALDRARSDLSQVEADLRLEMGRQSVARRDYALLDSSRVEGNEDLILRKPQMETVEARVGAARAAVRRAELDLERTRIRAPFNAHILAREVDVGSYVSPGDDLGMLVGLDSCWVGVTVPLAQLPWLAFPDEGQEGSAVTIRTRSAWKDTPARRGTLHRLVGALEEDTRLARVLVEVPDPFSLGPGQPDAARLMIGAFVEVEIQGRELPPSVRLSRDYLRDDGTVWVMEDGELRVREVDVLVKDARHAYVVEGLGDGDRVITTNLSRVTEGAPVRLQGDAPDTAAAPAGGEGP